ncbi:MAG: hypothetical protein ACH349_02730 [Candidatus Rhabdochlamydia sp.]
MEESNKKSVFIQGGNSLFNAPGRNIQAKAKSQGTAIDVLTFTSMLIPSMINV